jgi:glycosyltransferase involved in cell wall biosynthesis
LVKVKICHISEATSGGVFSHLEQLALNLGCDKFEQTFVLSSLKGPELKKLKHFYHNPLIIIDMQRNISLLNDLISLFKLIIFLINNRFDVIHCHSTKAGIIGRIAAQLTFHNKVFYTPHAFAINPKSNLIKNSFIALIERFLGLITTNIICVSKGERFQAINYRIAKKNKLLVVPNGIEKFQVLRDDDKRRWLIDQNIHTETKIIGFVGRLVEQKNPEAIVEACLRLKLEDFILVIIGDGPLKNKLVSYAEQKKIDSKIRFLGNVTNAKQYFSLFDLYVLTSLYEGLPYTVLEAMIAEVPVITFDILGVNELIINGQTGITVAPNDIDGLAEAITRILNSTNLCKKLTTGAYEHVSEEYNIEKMVKTLKGIYTNSKEGLN